MIVNETKNDERKDFGDYELELEEGASLRIICKGYLRVHPISTEIIVVKCIPEDVRYDENYSSGKDRGILVK